LSLESLHGLEYFKRQGAKDIDEVATLTMTLMATTTTVTPTVTMMTMPMTVVTTIVTTTTIILLYNNQRCESLGKRCSIIGRRDVSH
jgi:hypothetical protein